MQIKGQAAIVTGAASGLGQATAHVLAEAGARVTILDVNEDGARAAARAIDGLGVACDVTSAESVSDALRQAEAAHGPARICVNCAGIVAGGRVVGKDGAPHDLAVFSRVIAINLIGTFNVMSQAAAAMVGLGDLDGDDHERGVIINTASIAATEGQVGQVAYAASKGGVASLTLPAARDLARSGVRVACIAPGLFLTPMMEGLPQDVYDALIKKTLHPHRMGRPEEFGRMVRALIETPMMNGSITRLDGALRLEPR
ncbi:SDR family NAD(P)-dependent oxidoreductase [Roseospira visakhapatnamensis]|uniref:NAD(P)-dependent dehydrogenase (Short-subunit alcohol dehydrogenase family) n=1 Tax=Roseospira visakhapatnamensis TaxID=390880 RepID=A0A7W6RF41_9PROT|nr:SDR family NAD(P)-dependent oxidoreductase [Roseospira visakhapatnamensis]MBB4267399.1 NAD(P)-dependent dehydrogenase (short-subunit alcohol dehydrogenase family) [Roseospira visakhapatnamensis]